MTTTTLIIATAILAQPVMIAALVARNAFAKVRTR
jgi:hypothetical protein